VKSYTLPSFWNAYTNLDEQVKRSAMKAFRLWKENPFHPSLRFKCINVPENMWAVRITLGYRAIGIWEGDEFTWIWIGGHDEYERFFG
jgi:hypothetical protein